MSKFDKHFCMKTQDAIDYIREKLPDYFGDARLECKEIGDGNINYVFRVKEVDGDKSIVVKHADIYFRGTTDAVDVDRNRIEARILQIENSLCPKQTPFIYLYDPIMCCVVMEDIKDHRNMRYCMIDHQMFSNLAEDISSFLVNTLIGTTDLIISPEQKKEWDKEFINPDMCEITERLVLEEPYKNKRKSNKVLEENIEFVKKELYDDSAICLEAAKLKFNFQTKSQSLLHGDLHSGSIFIKEGSIKILDPEFAFYGPAGYDIGNVIAHLIFAFANAEATMCDNQEKDTFENWVLDNITRIVDLFKKKAINKITSETTDVMFDSADFIEYYVDEILKDTAGYTGLELIRRTIGSAKVKDLTCIEDMSKRAKAERFCVLVGKELIMNRNDILCGKQYVDIINNKK